MEYQYVGLGYDCSPAAALRALQLRTFALPFDWVVSTRQALVQCIINDFEGYHTELRLISTKTRVVDKYGFLFPHDYPTVASIDKNNTIEADGIAYEEKVIVDHFELYSEKVISKYKRRIERFRAILRNDDPVIFLFRGCIRDAEYFKKLFSEKYHKENVCFVVATREENKDSTCIVVCDPEKKAAEQ